MTFWATVLALVVSSVIAALIIRYWGDISPEIDRRVTSATFERNEYDSEGTRLS